MKNYKVLTYLGIFMIVISIIGFPITNNPEIRFGCCMCTVLGMYALTNANINKLKHFQNE